MGISIYSNIFLWKTTIPWWNFQRRPEESYCSEHQAAHGGVCHQRLQGGVSMGHGLMPWVDAMACPERFPSAPGLGHQPTVLEHPKATGRGTHPAMEKQLVLFFVFPKKASKNWTRALIFLIFFPSSKLKFSKFSGEFFPTQAYPQAHPPCGRLAWFEAGMVNARKELASLRAKVSIPFPVLAFMAFTNKNTGIVSGIEWVYMIIYIYVIIYYMYIYNIWLMVWNMNSIFPHIGKSNPIWLIFFRGVETTNQMYINNNIHTQLRI